MRTNKYLAALAALAVGMSACKKDDAEPPAGPSGQTTGTVKMSFTFTRGDMPFGLSQTFHDGAGNDIRISKLKFYVSDIHLSDDDGNVVADLHDTYLLVDASATSNLFTLGAVPPAAIHEAHITLGLESEVNHADPTLAEAPLNDPDMHWSWNPAMGYKFLALEGKVDGNHDGDFDDAEDIGFTYHCAGDGLLRGTHVHIHADVEAGSTATLAAKVDVEHLVSGLDLLGPPMAMGAEAANITAMDSLVTAIGEM